MESKLEAAKAYLGERYVLHPINRVKRAPHRTPEIAKVDVAKTIKRAAQRMRDEVPA